MFMHESGYIFGWGSFLSVLFQSRFYLINPRSSSRQFDEDRFLVDDGQHTTQSDGEVKANEQHEPPARKYYFHQFEDCDEADLPNRIHNDMSRLGVFLEEMFTSVSTWSSRWA